jgi:hypothetical protein
MSNALRRAQSQLRLLSSVTMLLEARQRDADEITKYGLWTDMNVRGLEAEIANAQLELAYQTRAAADAVTPDPKEPTNV